MAARKVRARQGAGAGARAHEASEDGVEGRAAGRDAARPVALVLEEISAAVVLAEPDDCAALERLTALFEEITAGAEGPAGGQVRAAAEQCAALLRSGMGGSAGAAAQLLQDLGTRVGGLQRLLSGAAAPSDASPRCTTEARAPVSGETAKARPAADAAAAPAGACGEALVLPEWAEESVLREFLSAQEVVIPDLEACLLALERGDADQLQPFRRMLHTLKGEAGALGLEDLEQVCHAVEDFLEVGGCAPRSAGPLLEVLDWMTRSAGAYSRMQRPQPPGAAVVAELRRALPAPASVAPAAAPAAAGASSPPPTAAAAATAPPAAASAPSAAWDPGDLEAPIELLRDEETVALVGEFLNEGDEGLAQADRILMNAERDGTDSEKINGLFRVFHSLKGVAASLELSRISGLAHTTETMLNRCRQGELALKGGVLDLVFDATTMMRTLLGNVRAALQEATPLPPMPELRQLVARIRTATEGGPVLQRETPAVRPGASLGEILTQAPFNVPAEAVARAAGAQKTSGRRIGEELAVQGVVEPREVAEALRAQARAAQAGTVRLRETVKVDLERVDDLVEMIGELVIVEAMVVNAPEIEAIASARVRNCLGQLAKVTRDLQDVGMRMRMVPLGGVFQKMARMVRDLSHKSGKQVQLQLSGESAEMDRGMVEQLADPLVHMIRNSMDHGIEPPEERVKAGKPAGGTIRLAAFHEGGSIVIEVADDGRGLDREAILRKAAAQGLIKEGDSLGDAEIHALIFAPGFSTARTVTEISGRGVGMDVVRRNIEAMRGRVQISTVPGAGTKFRIVLPLTLAIIDGMLVRCGSERYIIPTLSIVESIQPDRSMLLTLARTTEMINVRGEILPLLRLDRLFRLEGARTDPTEALVVVVEGMGRKLGLLVDDVVTQQQVVIKSVGAGIHDVRLVSGAAILADGRVGLILNIEQMAALVEDKRRRSLRESASAASASLTDPPLRRAA